MSKPTPALSLAEHLANARAMRKPEDMRRPRKLARKAAKARWDKWRAEKKNAA